jgi:membrane-associated protease RseP (regulator of RpoE activity)
MNRILTVISVILLLLVTTVTADMERPKAKEMTSHRSISDAAGYRSPRGIDDIRCRRSMPPEPTNELLLQARGLEGRALRGTPVRKTQKAWLGLRIRNLESQLAAYFGVKEGLLVAEVLDEGPALLAGIRAGDVIIAANSCTIHTLEDLDELVGCYEPGKTMSVVLVRNGESLKKQVRLASAP